MSHYFQVFSSRSVVNFLVNGNVWISLAAMAWVWQALAVLGRPDFTKNAALLLFMGSATLFTYSAQRSIKQHRRREVVVKSLIIHSLIGLFGMAMTSFYFTWPLLAIIGLVGGISAVYILRLFIYRGRRLAARQLPHTKLWLVALSWAICGTILPLMTMGNNAWQNGAVGLWFLEKFTFVAALTIPFDIRDLRFDALEMKTLPQVVGVTGALQLAQLLLCISTLLGIVCGIYTFPELAGLIVSNGVTFLLIRKATPDRPALWFSGGIDGMLILQSLAVIGLG